MAEERAPIRRMTLRQLLTHSEKCNRDLAEQVASTLLRRIKECRELTRPVRKRSAFPSVLSLMNALQHLEEAGDEVIALTEYILEQLELIRDHAQREKANR